MKLRIKLLLNKILSFFIFRNFNFKLLKISVSEIINKNISSFFTYHLRPKKNWSYFSEYLTLNKKEIRKNGILIQGALKKEEDFTYETIKEYKKNYPEVTIVLSTWEDEEKNYLEKIKKLGCEILLNKKPEINGFGNNNLQIISTQKGLKFFKKLGIEYVLKTRTDQRIYDLRFLEFFENLLNRFPIGESILNQNKRIITLNIGTCIDIPFLISDMLQYGFIDDIWNMWNIPLQDKNYIPSKVLKNATPLEIFKSEGSELYIVFNFLKNINARLDFSYENHINILKERFIIVDKSMINLYWFKYSCEEYLNYIYSSKNYFRRINFIEWFNLIENDNYNINEKNIEKRLN